MLLAGMKFQKSGRIILMKMETITYLEIIRRMSKLSNLKAIIDFERGVHFVSDGFKRKYVSITVRAVA